jgi:hypothetical protein
MKFDKVNIWDNIKEIQFLLDQSKFRLSLEKSRKLLSSEFFEKQNRESHLASGQLAGLLIDIGEEGRIEEASILGLRIFEENYDILKQIIKEHSIEYNLGNAKSTLFKIGLRKYISNFGESRKKEYFSPENLELITQSKNHYWRAFKQIRKMDDESRDKLQVNLGISLSNSCRIIEAFDYFDGVICENKDFAMAYANRADLFDWIVEISGVGNQSMKVHAVRDYEKALSLGGNANTFKKVWRIKMQVYRDSLAKEGIHENQMQSYFDQIETDRLKYTDFQIFCIKNHLMLNEHSIYCNCIGATEDRLMIPAPVFPVSDKARRMELILNRLKSEYALARYLYYQASTDDDMLKKISDESKYSNLGLSESNSIIYEMYRQCFKICFGILDKIARAMCIMFDLAAENEPLYFVSFWKPRGKSLTEIQKERWDKINKIRNYGLSALFSQATDLNIRNGELSELKIWRDELEHEILLLLDFKREPIDDPYSVLGDFKFTKRADFINQTLLLLKFTRASIFYFVFCARSYYRGETK